MDVLIVGVLQLGVYIMAPTFCETYNYYSPRWQHGDVSASLASLDHCPFAVSMRAADRVLVLTEPWFCRCELPLSSGVLLVVAVAVVVVVVVVVVVAVVVVVEM